MSDAEAVDLLEVTTEIVTSYVIKNSLRPAELPALIASVRAALSGTADPASAAPEPEALKPAVSIKKSITDEFIISLEDGRKLKSLKRYLAGRGMTPADYRIKWGLPKDYPMVAPAYAKIRSEMAKTIGLGRKAAADASPKPDIIIIEPAKKRGRPKANAAA